MSPTHFLHQWLRRWADWVASHVDGGTKSQAWLAWGLLVGVPAGLAVLIHWLLAYTLGWLFAVAWNVALLYITLGFRQFSHHFTGIRDALNDGDEALARKLLAEWQQVEVNDLPRTEIVRHVIEHSILSAHRHVFGVFFSLQIGIGLPPPTALPFYLLRIQQNPPWSANHCASGPKKLGAPLIGCPLEPRPWALPLWEVLKMPWMAGVTMLRSSQMTMTVLFWQRLLAPSTCNWVAHRFNPMYPEVPAHQDARQKLHTLPKWSV